jgi:hypothetical protein
LDDGVGYCGCVRDQQFFEHVGCDVAAIELALAQSK